jgi:glycosyltransferase involved in cell wall biosynthesis
MAKLPLISIIVPVYNVGPFLKECLDSILGQTYQNLEIILIDDGSTDDSKNIIDAYAKKYKNIKAIHQKHQGVSSARNAGIVNVSGEWVSFIDPDDYVKKDFIENLHNVVTQNKADISSCGFESFSEDGGILKKSSDWPSKPLSGYEAINESMAQKRPAYLPLNLFKSSLFKDERIKFPVGQEYEDIAAKIKLLFYAKRVAFSNKKLYMYRIRKDSITGKKFTDSRYNDFLAAIKDVKNFLANSKDAKQFTYLNYFEFYSLATLLNYLAREPKTNANKKYWSEIHRKLKKLYRKTKFPSTKSKIIYGISLIVSSNRTVYSIIYKRIKK